VASMVAGTARKDELADVISDELGMPRKQSGPIQVGSGIGTFKMVTALEQRPSGSAQPVRREVVS
jgi:hypothetical protein